MMNKVICLPDKLRLAAVGWLGLTYLLNMASRTSVTEKSCYWDRRETLLCQSNYTGGTHASGSTSRQKFIKTNKRVAAINKITATCICAPVSRAHTNTDFSSNTCVLPADISFEHCLPPALPGVRSRDNGYTTSSGTTVCYHINLPRFNAYDVILLRLLIW